MRTAQELVIGLIKLGLVAAGVLYAVEALIAYVRLGEYPRPVFDSAKPLVSAAQWLVWAGVKALALAFGLSRPLVNALAEASADVGEWVLVRHHSQTTVTVQPRTR